LTNIVQHTTMVISPKFSVLHEKKVCPILHIPHIMLYDEYNDRHICRIGWQIHNGT